MLWIHLWNKASTVTSLNKKELEQRQQAWGLLNAEQRNTIRVGLVSTTERCRNHTVLLLRNRIPVDQEPEIDLIIGTGIFAKSGGRQGILTAAHVLNEIASLDSHKRGELGIGVHGHSGAIDQISLPIDDTIAKGLRNTEKVGPDIAWIDLSLEARGKIESHAGVFYNLDIESLEREGSSKEDQKIASTFVLVGYNAQLTTHAVEVGLNAVVTLPTQINPRIWKAQWSDAGGWDYGNCELYDPSEAALGELLVRHTSGAYSRGEAGVIDRGGDNEPSNWGGASGCGIWSLNVKTGEKKHWVTLEGIAFYQITSKSHHPTLQAPSIIRAHGPRSIRKVRDEWLR